MRGGQDIDDATSTTAGDKPTRARRVLRAGVWCVLASLLAITLWPPLADALVDPNAFNHPRDSVTVRDRHGAPLRLTRPDGEDRQWVRLHEVSPHLISAFIATEDARFHGHDGVDLRATLRGVGSLLIPGMRLSGGSTITQQTIKLTHGRPHGLWSKPFEMLRALAFEEHFDKDEILEQYLNRVPFGDRIVGVERACQAYFGKSAREVSLSEAALLAGIPQAPSVTEPRRHLARAMRRRAFVLSRMLQSGHITQAQFDATIDQEVPVLSRSTRPWHAARLVDRALEMVNRGEVRAERGEVQTSLDLPIHTRAQSITLAAVDTFRPRGVTNGAALVLDNHTGEIRAYVGAADPEGPGHALDLLRARRQPGSTLKPFVYTLLFEDGGTAATVLDDIVRPMTGADGAIFAAEDYDGQERGPVRARVALASSLNLAAIDAASRVGPWRIVERLRSYGMRLRAAEDYGVAIALGGPDVTALDLGRAYATLATGAHVVPSLVSGASRPPSGDEVDAAAAAVTRDILLDGTTREDAFGDNLEELAGGPFGLKTGTSSGWHDAWAATFDDDWTVVVWLGDPGGRAMSAVSGFEAAAPTAARILGAARELDGEHASASGEPRIALGNAIRAAAQPLVGAIAAPLHNEWAPEAAGVPPRGAQSETPRGWHTDAPPEHAYICSLSGARAGPHCGTPIHERFAPGTAPDHVCPFHRDGGRTELPPRYARWVAATQRARTMVTSSVDSVEPLRIVSPADGAVLMTDPARPATITVEARRGRAPARPRFWLDGVPLPSRSLQLALGEHTLEARVDGEVARTAFEVVSTTDAPRAR